MRLSPTELEKISRAIIKQLRTAGITIPDEPKVQATIINLINENMGEERKIEEDALKLMKQHRQAMGSAVDELKALRMIMQKLAQDRKFVL